MDFIDQLQALAAKIQKARHLIQTEEATKNAFVLPFIQALGYDVFNPLEVVPEFTADMGIKKGEKVDYAIFRDDKPIILFECKKCGGKLDSSCASQLYRYFSVTEARISVLTDGITYQFFTDLEEPNKMDTKPFMEINLLDLQETLVPELKKLTKSAFNLEATLNAASELKYAKEIRRIIGDEVNSPSEDFVKFFIPKVYNGKVTQKVKEQFTDIVRRALNQFINERINERIKTALATDEGAAAGGMAPPAAEAIAAAVDTADRGDEIVTSEEEREGYYIVKSIVREVVDLDRVAARDTMSYFGILLDDNNRKPICRLHFNRTQRRYIGLFDADKNEERVAIDTLNDIYKHADRLKSTVLFYLGGNVHAQEPEHLPAVSPASEPPAALAGAIPGVAVLSEPLPAVQE